MTPCEFRSAARETKGALARAYSCPPLPPSFRSLVPCQLVGQSRCEGELGQEKGGIREREKTPPW